MIMIIGVFITIIIIIIISVFIMMIVIITFLVWPSSSWSACVCLIVTCLIVVYAWNSGRYLMSYVSDENLK